MTNADLFEYDPWNPGPDIAVGPSGGVSIVGFPFGLSGGGYFGLWVQGFLASEPEIDFSGLPAFLVDSRTRPGQSGSPVVAYRSGGAVEMADASTNFFNGPVERFLGIYSGRINEQSDLGFVWRASAIAEIVDGNRHSPTTNP